MWKCVSSMIDIIENMYNFCYTMGTIKFEGEELSMNINICAYQVVDCAAACEIWNQDSILCYHEVSR